jgi:hypothetical protein
LGDEIHRDVAPEILLTGLHAVERALHGVDLGEDRGNFLAYTEIELLDALHFGRQLVHWTRDQTGQDERQEDG